MPVTRPNPEKLAVVLKNVSAPVAQFIVREIEVNRSKGHDEPIYEMALSTVRGTIQKSGEKLERVNTPKRLFCSFFEEYLVDRRMKASQRGRIERASIGPIWDWLTTEGGPENLSPLVEELHTQLKRNDSAGVAKKAQELCARAAAAITKSLSSIQGNPLEQRRLAARLGGKKVLQDAVQIRRVLASMPALVKLRSVLPQSAVIQNRGQIEHLADLLKRSLAEVKHHPELPVGLMMGRLSRPIDITRVITSGLGSREGSRIATSQYAVGIELVIYDMGLLGAEITDCLKQKNGIAPTLYWLSRLHEYSTELMENIDINLKSDWGKSLLEVRNSVSTELYGEISRVPSLLKQLYRRRPNSTDRNSFVEPDSIAVFEALHGLALAVACRSYLDQLSLNQVINETDIEVRRYLRIVSDAMIIDIRATKGAQQAMVLKWFETSVQFTRVILGEEDARLLERSAEVASRAVAS